MIGMIGDHDDLNEVNEIDDELDQDEELDQEASSDDLSLPNANVGEISVEIDVEELIAELEADSGVTYHRKGEDPRKRLEKLLEERRIARELEEIDEFALDTFD